MTIDNCNKKTDFGNKSVFDFFVRNSDGTNAIEIRILEVYGKHPLWDNKFARGTVNGYFDNFDSFFAVYNKLINCQHKFGFNVFFIINDIDNRLLARSYNRLTVSKHTTSDKDITGIRFIPIDIDPVRPAGIPASVLEIELAYDCLLNVCNYLEEAFQLVSGDDYKIAFSGNGYHILIDFKSVPEKHRNVERFIKIIGKMFSSTKVSIDLSVTNPSRMMKLYGVENIKGDEVSDQDRFYRQSYICNTNNFFDS